MVALYGACICSQGGRSFLEVFHWLQHDIVDRGRLPLLCCLVAFVLTFLVTRSFVRFITVAPRTVGRPGGGSREMSTSGRCTSTTSRLGWCW